MGLPAQQLSTTPSAHPSSGPQTVGLKRGEKLFNEGDNSKAMYFLKSGIIRIFKKKGDSDIEIDTVRAGQVLGELAFLDGNPRSASAEALTECELVVISATAFQLVVGHMPEWLKILLRTIVGRLRTASTRIRQLETASTAYSYSEKSGKRSPHYVYLTPIEVLKICSGILLVASRNGTKSATGIDVRVGLLQRYCNQIMGVPVAKIQSMLDVLKDTGAVTIYDEEGNTKAALKDIDFLESLIAHLNEENLLEPEKRHDITLRSFMIMSLIAKHLSRFKTDAENKTANINVALIKNEEAQAAGKEPFRFDDFPELVKIGYVTALTIKNNNEAYTTINVEEFMKAYRFQRIVMTIQVINEQKRRGIAK